MKIEEVLPSCNLDTVRDGRGGIFTFIPKDPIVEFNYNCSPEHCEEHSIGICI